MSTSPSASGHAYLPALDGMRGASIALVFVSHAGLGHVVPGGLGVTVFFFISGYIITRLMLAELGKHGSLDIKGFYLRRFFRLMPALYAYVLVCLVVLWIAGQRPAWTDVAAVLFYFGNYWNIGGHFQNGIIASPFPITWSLAVEEHYYLVYPLLMAALGHRPARLLAAICGLLAAVLAWRLWLVHGIGLDALRPDRIYMATDTRLDSILYGAAFAVLSKLRSDWLKHAASLPVFLAGLLLLAITLVVRDPEFRETWRYSLQGVALACLLQRLVFGQGWSTRLLSSAPATYVGRISYSLYLYHWLMYVLVSAARPDLAWPLKMTIMVGLSWPAAHLSWRWVERAGLQWRHRLFPASR